MQQLRDSWKRPGRIAIYFACFIVFLVGVVFLSYINKMPTLELQFHTAALGLALAVIAVDMFSDYVKADKIDQILAILKAPYPATSNAAQQGERGHGGESNAVLAQVTELLVVVERMSNARRN